MFNSNLKIVRGLVLLCVLGFYGNSSVASAQENGNSPAASSVDDVKGKSNAKPADKKKKNGKAAFQERLAEEKTRFESLSEERKTELLDFVSENHAELKGLLKRLQNKRPRLFQRAVNSLDRDVTKLQTIENRNPANPERYEMALKEWKLKSRVEVLSAQLAIKDSKEKREQLRSMMGEMLDLNLQQRKLERGQLVKRLETLSKRISDMEDNREATIDRRIKSVENKARDLRRSSSKNAKKKSETNN